MPNREQTISALRTRPSLLFRLRDWKDEASWTEFYRLYYKFVFDVARQSGLRHADAEEVAQDVFKRVSETVHEFESDPARGTFRGWLTNLARWRIVDKFRRLRFDERQPAIACPTEDARTSPIERIGDEAVPEKAWDDEWHRHLVETALGRLARRIPPMHFQMFDLYTRQEWPARKIARELKVSAASVYLVTHRLKKQLKAELEILRRQVR